MRTSTTVSPSPIAWRWIVIGGLVLATLDALFATLWWQVTAHVPWTRVFQSVAGGVLGMERSVAGGEPAAWLGLGLHYAIAMCFPIAYVLVAARMHALVRRAVFYGALYGLLLYAIMNLVVIPLSAIGKMPKFDNVPWVATSIVMHAVFGLICAVAARRAILGVSVRRPAFSTR